MSKKHLQLLLRWEAYNLPGSTCKNEMQGLFNEEIMSVAQTARNHERQKKKTLTHWQIEKGLEKESERQTAAVKGFTLTY